MTVFHSGHLSHARGGEEVTGGRRKDCLEGWWRQKPQQMHWQGSDGTNTNGEWLDGVRRGWKWKRVAGKCSTCPHESVREVQAAGEEMRVAGA